MDANIDIIVCCITVLGSIAIACYTAQKTVKLKFFDAYFSEKVNAYNAYLESIFNFYSKKSISHADVALSLAKASLFCSSENIKTLIQLDSACKEYLLKKHPDIHDEELFNFIMNASLDLIRLDIQSCRQFKF